MKKQLQDNHFVTIPGWVINHLHLTGDDAIVYSLILGYKEGFQEPLSHIAQWIGSEDTVRRCLLRLTKQGCIDVCRRGGKPTIYRCKPLASCDPSQVATPCNLLPQPLASCDPNNIYNISTTTESARTCTCEGDEKNATAGDKCETPTNDKQRILGWLLDDTDGLTILLHRVGLLAEPKPPNELREMVAPYVDEYYAQQRMTGKEDIERRGRSDVKQHFAYWLPKYIKYQQQTQNNNNNATSNSRSYSGTREGLSYEEFCRQVIPGFNSGLAQRGR